MADPGTDHAAFTAGFWGQYGKTLGALAATASMGVLAAVVAVLTPGLDPPARIAVGVAVLLVGCFLVSLGFAYFTYAQAQRLVARNAPRFRLEHNGGGNGRALVTVHNDGGTADVTAFATVVRVKEPHGNTYTRHRYTLPWVETPERMFTLKAGDSGTLRLATAALVPFPDTPITRACYVMEFWTAGDEKPINFWRWNAQDTNTTEITLRVEVTASPAPPQEAVEQFVIIGRLQVGGLYFGDGDTSHGQIS